MSKTFYQLDPSSHQNFQHYRLEERKIPHIHIQDVNDIKKFYDFSEKIGHGSFGSVLEIIDKTQKKKLAMKIISKNSDSDRIKYTRREIQILKLINHPHIIDLVKVFESPKKLYLVMEKCRDLFQLYKQKTHFTENEAKKMIKELTEAVAYLHKYDIVHRDIKMENILLGGNPNDPSDELYIKLTDFGLSVVKFGLGVDSMLSEYCGTIFYMAPELITKSTYSQQCDIWAIGIITYMMLFGEMPFEGNSKKNLENEICHNEPPRLSSSTISLEACDLLKMMLKKKAVDRITAIEILQHPWILNKKMDTSTKIPSTNILDVMKEWKEEMKVSKGGEESDWFSAGCKSEENRK